MRADPFEVWGNPPQHILDQLSRDDRNKLRRYVDGVASKVYKLAYELGAKSAGHGETATEPDEDG